MSSVSEKRKTFNYWDDSSESEYFHRLERKKKTKLVINDSNSPVNRKFRGSRATKINRINNCSDKDKLHTKSNLFRNRPSSSRSKVTVTKYNKVTNNEMSEHNSNTTDFVVRNICRKYRKQQAGQKLDTILNFKLYIIKIIEKSKHIFSTFKSQLNHFGLNYVKNEIETLEDAENIIFIINCILGEAKKELTQRQQELYRMYFQQKTRYKSKRLTLNAQNKQCVNTKNLQSQFESCSESDSNNDSRFQNMYNKVSVTASKIPIDKSDSLKSKEPISQQPNTKNQVKLTLEGNCISTAQNDDSILSNSNESIEHVLHNLKEINLIKKPSNTSVVDSKTTKSNTPNVKTLKQKLKKTTEHVATVQQDSYRSTRAKRNTPTRPTLDYNSDVSSTCSTIAWWSFRNDNVQQNGRDENDLIDTDIAQRENRSTSPILCTNVFDDILQNSNDEGVDYARIEERTPTTRSKSEHLNSEKQFIVPTVNISSMKGKSKPIQSLNTLDIISKQKLTEKEKILDKKLLMKCQVLIDKFKLSNIETSQK
ncbi:uncharacterized protein LOC143347485 [Colletes latitarsis]|uniref:uncharacterized protein LOC143347485 n=1 Tax=Colletes latitarsis TaxID=2605962 RepID=UPI00403567C3